MLQNTPPLSHVALPPFPVALPYSIVRFWTGDEAAMMGPLLQPQHLEYIDQRKALSARERYSSRPHSTIQKPHVCSHCQALTVVQTAETGFGVPSFSVVPQRDLRQVIEAAQDSCDLFICLVDQVVDWVTRNKLESFDRSHTFCLDGFHDGLDFRSKFTGPSWDEIPHKLLSGWTNETDPAAKYFKTRPYEHDKASEKSQNFARDSLRMCLTSHVRCRFPEIWTSSGMSPEVLDLSAAPSRLLKVTRNGEEIYMCLVSVSEMDQQDRQQLSSTGFAALSYCWGRDQPVKLTSESAPSLKQGFISTKLPKTLSDAAWFCDAIGLGYIWVDALCIFQDSSSDKALEISRMKDYYGKSVLTISAASASTCEEGLFTTTAPTYDVGPVRMAFRSVDGETGAVFLQKRTDPQPEAITTRGWTLQEAMLSRRMLVFASDELHWTCQTSYGACSGAMVDRIFGSPGSLVKDIYPLTTLSERPIWSQWNTVVTNYSRRRLGFPADKLPGVSALASALHDVGRSRAQDHVYVAGLLIEAKFADNWGRQLLWSTMSTETRRHEKEYLAPTWSWASIEGPVQYSKSAYAAVEFDTEQRTSVFSVEQYGVTLQDERAPYGMIKDAYISLRAKLRSLSKPLDMDVVFLDTSSRSGGLAATKLAAISNPYLAVSSDTPNCNDFIEKGLMGDTGVFMLLLAPAHGLLIMRVGFLKGGDTYRRLGFFECTENSSQDVSDELEERRMRLIFQSEKLQSLILV